MRFPREHPDYGQDAIDWLRIIEFSRLDTAGHTYLDYTGACLYPESLVLDHLWDLRSSVYGNPHSDSPASIASTHALALARDAVLQFFNADPSRYDVVFTANATAAMQLVGLSYPYEAFVYTADVHNSALGLREIARARKSQIRYLLLQDDLRIPDTALISALANTPAQRRLLVYPAQCNFSGVQHPLGWIHTAHMHNTRVLLDAAAYVPTNRLDLTEHPADYVAVSWYKVFGYPTGIGCLIATHEALAELEQPWHSGGTTKAASVAGNWFHLVSGGEGFEHGTVNYLALPAVINGLDFIHRVGIQAIHDRMACLTQWTLHELHELSHSNGVPMVRFYGPLNMELRGGIIAFNLCDPDGKLVNERIVSQQAAATKISLRTGCFCVPGAGEAAFGLTEDALDAAGALDKRASFDDYLRVLGMPTGGAIRVSYGLGSNAADAERFLSFIESFRDQHPAYDDLPPRVHC